MAHRRSFGARARRLGARARLGFVSGSCNLASTSLVKERYIVIEVARKEVFALGPWWADIVDDGGGEDDWSQELDEMRIQESSGDEAKGCQAIVVDEKWFPDFVGDGVAEENAVEAKARRQEQGAKDWRQEREEDEMQIQDEKRMQEFLGEWSAESEAEDLTAARVENEKSPAVQVTPLHKSTCTGDLVDAHLQCHDGQAGHEKGGECGPKSPPGEPTRGDHPRRKVSDAPAIDPLSQSPRSQHYRELTSQSSFSSERRRKDLSFPMCIVAFQGDVEEAQFLLALGASVNRIDEGRQRTPLQEAMRNDQRVMAKFLASQGAVAEPSEVSLKREEQRIAEFARNQARLFGKLGARERALFEDSRRLHPNAVLFDTTRRETLPKRADCGSDEEFDCSEVD